MPRLRVIGLPFNSILRSEAVHLRLEGSLTSSGHHQPQINLTLVASFSESEVWLKHRIQESLSKGLVDSRFGCSFPEALVFSTLQ